LDFVSLVKLVSVSTTVIWAPATTAPEASVTRPDNVAVSTWEKALAAKSEASRNSEIGKVLFIENNSRRNFAPCKQK
jgi:hypothetical protein